MSSAAATPHDPRLAHHFESLEHQHETTTLGMWVFIVQEVMFFGGAFTVYAVYRYLYPVAFGLASHHLDRALGAINTAVLITSSLTMALAVHYARAGRSRTCAWMLIATLLLGLAFLGVKAHEYSDKWRHHLVPGSHFRWDGDPAHARHAELFYACYFGLTGMHALHMVIGAAILIPLIRRSLAGRYGPEYYLPIELFGLYWHFVDVVWIYLFPLLYLAGS